MKGKIPNIGDIIVTYDLASNSSFKMIGKVIEPITKESSTNTVYRGQATYIALEDISTRFYSPKLWCYWEEDYRDYRIATYSERVWLQACIKSGKLVNKPWCFASFLKFKV